MKSGNLGVVYYPAKSDYRIDWIRYVVPFETGIRHALPDCCLDYSIKPLPTGRLGYTNHFTSSEGFKVFWNAERSDMGIMVEMTGSTINAADYESYNISPQIVFAHINENGGHLTRVDFAIDLMDTKYTPQDLTKMIEKSQLEFNGKEHTVIESKAHIDGELASMGQTLYMGSRASDRYIRFYDKAAEQKILGVTWARLEMEIKGKRAAQMTKALTSDTAGIHNAIFANEVLGYIKPVKKPAKAFYALLKGILEEPKVWRYSESTPNPSHFFDFVLMPFIRRNAPTLSEERLRGLAWLVENELRIRNTD